MDGLEVIPGDTIVVYSRDKAQVQWLSWDGAIVRKLDLETSARVQLSGVLADGRMIFRALTRFAPGTHASGVQVDSEAVFVADSRSKRPVHVATLPRAQAFVVNEAGRMTVTTPPFARYATYGIAGACFVHGYNDRSTIQAYRPDSALTRDPALVEGLRTDFPPDEFPVVEEANVNREALPVSPGDVERAKGNFLYGWKDTTAGLDLFGRMPVPATHQRYTRSFVSADGNLWVADAGADGDSLTWQVFRNGWRKRAVVRLDARYRPLSARDGRLLSVVHGTDADTVMLQFIPDTVKAVLPEKCNP